MFENIFELSFFMWGLGLETVSYMQRNREHLARAFRRCLCLELASTIGLAGHSVARDVSFSLFISLPILDPHTPPPKTY